MTFEHLAPDIRELIRLLHEHRVRYLLIGGEAVVHHGYARLTGDVDFTFDQARANCARLFAALTEFWDGPVPAVDRAEDLMAEGVVVQFGRQPNRVDLLGSLGKVSFARAWRNRVEESLDTGSGRVPIYVIGLTDLIAVKREAGRHKDLDDVEHLKAIRRAERKASPTKAAPQLRPRSPRTSPTRRRPRPKRKLAR